MKYYWTAEPEKNFRNRYSGTWKTSIPSNGFKVTRNDYKTILTDPDAIDAAERYFNYHTRAFQCVVTYWARFNVDGHSAFINPNNKKEMAKYDTEIIEDLSTSLNESILHEALANPERKAFLDSFLDEFKDVIDINDDAEIYFEDEELRDEVFNFCFQNSTDHSFYSRLFDEKTKIELYDKIMSDATVAYDLTTITIPDSVTSIGIAAFEKCTSLTSINIPDSVTSIGIGAFNSCSNLKSVILPRSIKKSGCDSHIFDRCDSLEKIICDNLETTEYLKKCYPQVTIICNGRQITLKENLEEDIEKHNTLNPLLWNADGTLKEEVHDKIIEIANDFIDNLKQDGIKFDLKDIRIVGSNCSYNYTKDSDLDVHLIADSSSLNCPDELYPLLYSSYRSIFNKNLDIDFYGIPVEIYVEVE